MTDPLINPPTAAEFQAIADTIAEQTKLIEHLNDRLKLSETRTVFMAGALLILVGVVMFVGFLSYSVNNQNNRLESSIREQCSLYELIIPSYRDAARAASPLGPEGYDNAFRQMQVSADHLNCRIPHRVPGT
jgi:hypothetical protein